MAKDDLEIKASKNELWLVALRYHLDIETEWTETVVAADHRAHRVLHPAIVEVPFTSGQ